MTDNIEKRILIIKGGISYANACIGGADNGGNERLLPIWITKKNYAQRSRLSVLQCSYIAFEMGICYNGSSQKDIVPMGTQSENPRGCHLWGFL